MFGVNRFIQESRRTYVVQLDICSSVNETCPHGSGLLTEELQYRAETLDSLLEQLRFGIVKIFETGYRLLLNVLSQDSGAYH